MLLHTSQQAKYEATNRLTIQHLDGQYMFT